MMRLHIRWRALWSQRITAQKRPARTARHFSSVITGGLLLFCGLLSIPGQADEKYLLAQSTYKALSAIHDLMDKQKYTSALKKLRELQQEVQGEDKPYEHAVILQTVGYLYSSTEDYPKAIKALRKSLSLNALPAKVSQDLHYMLAQLYMSTEQYAVGVKFLETWFKQAKAPPAQAYVLLANAYYQLGRYPEIISPVVTAIDLAKKPPESWYQLHLAANLELKRYPQAAQVLETLISLLPEKEQYWKQLAAVYLQLKEEHQALAVQALLARMGHLEGKGLVYLSDLYRYLSIPYKAGQILQRALNAGTVEASIENWERTANAWSAAHEWEKSVEAFDKAGKLSQKGKFDLYRAQILIGHQRWDEAIAALHQALHKDGLEDAGQARFLLGQACYEQGRLTDAIKALKLAQRSPKYDKPASRWLKHLRTLQQQTAARQG